MLRAQHPIRSTHPRSLGASREMLRGSMEEFRSCGVPTIPWGGVLDPLKALETQDVVVFRQLDRDIPVNGLELGWKRTRLEMC